MRTHVNACRAVKIEAIKYCIICYVAVPVGRRQRQCILHKLSVVIAQFARQDDIDTQTRIMPAGELHQNR